VKDLVHRGAVRSRLERAHRDGVLVHVQAQICRLLRIVDTGNGRLLPYVAPSASIVDDPRPLRKRPAVPC
jgi:hypothetical protein